MSSLWTPEGEHPVGRARPEPTPTPSPSAMDPGDNGEAPSSGGAGRGDFEEEPTQAELDELRQQLAQAPVEVVVANHAFGLFELAALHLSLQPPQLDEARLAIDAVAALTEGLAGRLGEAEPTLREGLAQLRLAYVQIKTLAEGGEATDGEGD